MDMSRVLVIGLTTIGLAAFAAAGALFWLMMTRPGTVAALVGGGL
jgi:hypothetical protein